LLVFDNHASGHRANYVELFADIAGGTPLISPFARALPKLLFTRNLILPTFEGAPRRNLLLVLARMLLRRKTAVIFLRAHLFDHRSATSRLAHAAMLQTFGRNRCVLPMSIVGNAALSARCPSIQVIVDPEFWDFEFRTPAEIDRELAEEVRRRAARRKILLIAGTLSADKAIDELGRLFEARPDKMSAVFPLAAGRSLPELQAVDFIYTHGMIIDRHLSDSEFNTLFAVADFAWCAYRPERDMSSGILGRCIQTGVIPIVRQGSVAAQLARDWTAPVILDFSDLAGSAARLAGREGSRQAVPHDRLEAEGNRVRRILADFFGDKEQQD
jgi:hypothetical protein